jgi:hypothetical protein
MGHIDLMIVFCSRRFQLVDVKIQLKGRSSVCIEWSVKNSRLFYATLGLSVSAIFLDQLIQSGSFQTRYLTGPVDITAAMGHEF